MIRKLDEQKMKDFWKEFGTSLKLGVIEDQNNRSRIAKLLRFQSSHHATDATTLDEYIERMKDTQQEIFFMAGTSRAEVEKSPFVERLLHRGYEVLFLTEPIDEYVVQHLSEYEKKKFQNVAKVHTYECSTYMHGSDSVVCCPDVCFPTSCVYSWPLPPAVCTHGPSHQLCVLMAPPTSCVYSWPLPPAMCTHGPSQPDVCTHVPSHQLYVLMGPSHQLCVLMAPPTSCVYS